ncbi:calmodulin-binding protein 60 A-like isoform X2 [Salvia hispanica]|uniref:calmodulin-binding protein 60 A-like isoform X2 n=1 Tax=Salvia hispanica TaxID=49212 RepID=UPI00200968E3|nr:calmodulin-binding protein 60 A-like isoform X2 [Salvia hispanica]
MILGEESGNMVLKACSQVSKMANRGVPVTDDLIRRMVIEGFQPDAERLRCKRTWNEFPEERNLQLKFLDNKVANTVSGEEFKGLKQECLKLALLDSNEHTVTCGPGSSAKVDILLLEDNDDGDGDESNMTPEKFERSIIQKGDKKKPHLSPKSVYILLKNGVADLKGIKLGHDKDWIKVCSCRLGARIAQNLKGITVQEAWTAPFKVKDKRAKQYDKFPCPSLTSEVWRLKGIGRTGKRSDRLKEKYIETVQDFLFWFHVNPEELQNKILNVGDGRWKTIVSHAQKCKIDCEKMFCHRSSTEPQRCVIYDCVGKLKGDIMESQFVGIDNLCADRKDDALKLLRSVLERASTLYDDKKDFRYTITSTICDYGSLGSKERGVVSNPDPQFTPLHITDYELEGGLDSAAGGEMVGGGGSKESATSALIVEQQLPYAYEYYHSSPNPMEQQYLQTESMSRHVAFQHLAGVCGSSSGIHLYDSLSIMNLIGVEGSTGSLFAGFDELRDYTFGCEHGQMNTASELVVRRRKRWRTLFIVLKISKREVVDVSPARKKQRVG